MNSLNDLEFYEGKMYVYMYNSNEFNFNDLYSMYLISSKHDKITTLYKKEAKKLNIYTSYKKLMRNANYPTFYAIVVCM